MGEVTYNSSDKGGLSEEDRQERKQAKDRKEENWVEGGKKLED